MHGELAQLVALTAHGSAFLSGLLTDAPELDHRNTTFQYVRDVEFIGCGDCTASVSGTTSWLLGVQRAGARRLFVTTPSSGAWSVVAPRALRSHVWAPEWTVVAPDAPDRRIWHVTYVCRTGARFAEHDTVSAARDALAEALDAATRFSERDAAVRQWVRWFVEARQLLDDPAPEPPYHADMLPDVGYGLAARQLLAASARAWVFGGMGSWNEALPDDVREYERVSSRLFGAVVRGCRIAVNSFDGSQSRSRRP